MISLSSWLQASSELLRMLHVAGFPFEPLPFLFSYVKRIRTRRLMMLICYNLGLTFLCNLFCQDLSSEFLISSLFSGDACQDHPLTLNIFLFRLLPFPMSRLLRCRQWQDLGKGRLRLILGFLLLGLLLQVLFLLLLLHTSFPLFEIINEGLDNMVKERFSSLSFSRLADIHVMPVGLRCWPACCPGIELRRR